MAKLLKKYIKSSLIKNTFKNSLASLIMGEIQTKVKRFHLNSCYEKIPEQKFVMWRKMSHLYSTDGSVNHYSLKN